MTIPRAVREALGVSTGDQLIFRVQGTRAVVARTPEFLDLAGSVPVPESKRGASWDEVVESTRRGRSSERR
ncbi:MAG: AbrB/MazE/SpoVT family DNA-binding domain-containing protein [Candidatus Microthrix sp.]|nr:AbrB/MazE/SpoVT family DNA-binding domain-containing protein [Candidatus Microthrix sp.]